MARGRMINQTIDYDAEFNALSIEAQLIYLRTLAFLDRDGLIFGHPRALLAKVAPLLDISQADMMDIIGEWVQQGLVIRYTLKVGDILFFKGFSKNQSGMHYDRESPSRFDPPPGWTHGPKGLIPQESESTPPTSLDDSGTDAGETPTESEDTVMSESGGTPAELRQESGGESTQIEVEVKDQDQLKETDDDEDAQARDPLHEVWLETYNAEMPEAIEAAIAKELAHCSQEAIIHGIRVSVHSDSRSFKYLKNAVLNYLPPAPLAEKINYANGNGYHVDLADVPGVVQLQPTGAAPPAPLPPPMAQDDPWAVAVAELTPVFATSSAARWLEGSILQENGELAGVPFYRIVLTMPGANAQWMTQQAEPAIRKKLSSLLGKRIAIEIVSEKEFA